MVTQLYTPPYESVALYFNQLDVHEQEKVAGDEVLAIVLSLIWTVLHGLNCYLLFWQNVSLTYSFVIHLVLTLVIMLVTKVLSQAGRDARLLYVLTISSGGAGFFGGIGAMLASILTICYNHFSIPFSKWYEAIYPEFPSTQEQELYESITSGKDETAASYSVISFNDMMNFGSEGQKRRAITKMTDQFHPLFAPVFKLALQDESNTIRVQAAASIVKIENQFSQTLHQIERLEQKSPKDSALKLGLARYYDSFAFTGILDENREAENRKLALQKYKQYLDMRSNDIEARIEAGRLLLRSNQAEQAVELFQDCIKAGYGNDTVKFWLLEAYYQSERYEDLRRLAPEMLKHVENAQEIRPRLSQAIKFWGSSETGEVYGV
jgi:polysaccharide biosynthesis protein PelE